MIDHAETLRRHADRLLDQADRIERWAELLDLEEDAVIFFRKEFGGSKVYTYAGVLVDEVWYLTGSGRYPNAFCPGDLVEFLSTGVTEVWVATEMETL